MFWRRLPHFGSTVGATCIGINEPIQPRLPYSVEAASLEADLDLACRRGYRDGDLLQRAGRPLISITKRGTAISKRI